MKKLFPLLVLSMALIFLSIFFVRFFLKNENSSVQYTVKQSGTLGTDAGLKGVWKKIVDKEYVCLEEGSNYIDDYCFTLKEYFYDLDIGMMVYKIQVTYRNSLELTKEQFDILSDDFNKDNILISARTGSVCIDVLKKEGKNVYLYGNQLLSGIDSKERVNNFSDNSYVKYIELWWNDKMIYFPLPEYGQEEEKLIFDTSSMGSIYACQLGEYGLNIVWNLDNVISQFKEEMEIKRKELQNNFDEESYGYILYDTIKLMYNNGTQKTIIGNGKNKIKIWDMSDDEREEEKIANTRIAFDEKINLDKVEMIIIDGKKIRVN